MARRHRPFSCVVTATPNSAAPFADPAIDKFVAVDQDGRSFYADTEAAARQSAADYNGARLPKPQGVVLVGGQPVGFFSDLQFTPEEPPCAQS